MLARAGARRGSKVHENILAYLHFNTSHLWGELEGRLIQNRMETEKLTFQAEFDGSAAADRHPLHAQGRNFQPGMDS